jgi:hypothetical protein
VVVGLGVWVGVPVTVGVALGIGVLVTVAGGVVVGVGVLVKVGVEVKVGWPVGRDVGVRVGEGVGEGGLLTVKKTAERTPQWPVLSLPWARSRWRPLGRVVVSRVRLMLAMGPPKSPSNGAPEPSAPGVSML